MESSLAICWLLSPEPKQLGDLPVSTVKELIFTEEFLTLSTATEQLESIRRKLKVKREIVNQISSLTVGQRTNPSWHLVGKGRLTASNFGSVINAKRVTPSLVKRLLEEYDISHVKTVTWVNKCEKSGALKISEYFFFYGLQFQNIFMPTTRVVFGNFEGDGLSTATFS